MSERRESSRAELVRSRREKDHAKRIERAAQESTRPAPPITTRGRSEAGATPRRGPARRSGARRRFQVALPASRNDVRAISIPRPPVGPRLISFVIVSLLGSALYFAFNLPQLRVTEAQVTGSQILSPAEINSVLNVTGRPIFLLIPADLETRLRLNFPELVAVQVEVALPNTVSVTIKERQPVIRWEQAGSYTWISADGVAVRPRGEMSGLISVVAVSAPPLAGSEAFVFTQEDPLSPTPFISTEMVESLKGLAGHVPPGMQILYDASFGFGWNDPRGWQVYLGISARDVELKMRVYESLVSSLTQRGIRPALINVTYPTAPYYRMSQ